MSALGRDHHCLDLPLSFDGIEDRVAKASSWSHDASDLSLVSLEAIDGDKLILRDGEYSIGGSLEVIEEDEVRNIKVLSQLLSIQSAPLLYISQEDSIITNRPSNANNSHSRVHLDILQEHLKRLLESIILLCFMFVFFDEDRVISFSINADQLQSNVGAPHITYQSYVF